MYARMHLCMYVCRYAGSRSACTHGRMYVCMNDMCDMRGTYETHACMEVG